jgi:hypothetical protein
MSIESGAWPGSGATASGLCAGCDVITNLLVASMSVCRRHRFDAEDVVIRRVWERLEEAACAPAHVFAIGDHDPIVLVALHLHGAEGLPAVAFAKLALTGRPQVPDPVGLSAARDEISRGLVLERRDWGADRPATPPAYNGERGTAETEGDLIGFTTWRMKNPEGT